MELSADDIVARHDAALRAHDSGSADLSPPPMPEAAADSPGSLVDALHEANRRIWNLEDEARRRDAGDARIAAVKRAIDAWNQRRNDLMEAVDAAVLAVLAGRERADAELHSETPGMMVDRLSVLALKLANVRRVAAEDCADAALAAECRRREEVLAAQRCDLASCLDRLLSDCAAGRRRFKRYLQLKSYNDERLNPALRAASSRGTEDRRR